VPTRQAYSWLMRAPFKAYVTTNFDPLLSEAGATFGYNRLFRYPLLETREIDRGRKPIFYLHGHARPTGEPSGKDLVLAKSEFDSAYQGVLEIFVPALLLSYPIVFIGCGISEPEIVAQMTRVHTIYERIKQSYPGYRPKPRFVLLPSLANAKGPDAEKEQLEFDFFAGLDTQILRYAPTNPELHWEIEDILKTLCNLTMGVSEGGPGEAAPK